MNTRNKSFTLILFLSMALLLTPFHPAAADALSNEGADGRNDSSAFQQSDSANTIRWRGEYFTNPLRKGSPKLVRTDEKIDFNWKSGSPAAGIPANNFSVRWTSTATFETGIYRFWLLADDGAILKVGDRRVLKVPAGGAREQSYDLALIASKQKLVVEYYDRAGNASVRLRWEKLPSPTIFADWKGEYWSNRDLKGNPAIRRNDRQIDFGWNEKAPVLGMPRDNFSARWTRTINFPSSNYRFYAQANDGIRVYLDGKIALNEWHDSNGQKYSFDRQLSGKHTLVVEYYDRAGKASAKFWWGQVTYTPTPTATATSTSTPTATATATATSTPTFTPTPTPSTLYSFVEHDCEAEWRNGSKALTCPGHEDDDDGAVLEVINPILENGAVETQPTLLTIPEHEDDGLIRGTYPAFEIHSGDRFQAALSCAQAATACDVIYRLDYRIGDGDLKTLAAWNESNDGQVRMVDLDLSPLAGQSVRFVLTVLSNGSASQDRALWVFPRVVH
jgi:hypothetical protein